MCKLRQAFLAFCMLASGIVFAGSISAQNFPVQQEATAVPAEALETTENKKVFGDWIFGGEFANQSFAGFNPDYEISIGDNIGLKLWGGFDFTGSLTVDQQGNIFVPKVGPVRVLGVKNNDVNGFITEAIKQTFRKNVNVYASLGGAEPVKVFVTGFVNQPGLFAGHASDSVLYFLDQAGGIDPDRGSFLDIRVLRNGTEYRSVNLYSFILSGTLPVFQLADGDTIVVSPVNSQAGVFGEVKNPALFEFKGASEKASTLLGLARPSAQATHIRISRNNRAKTEVEYMPIASAENAIVYRGDVLEVMSDKNKGTISVRIEGEHEGAQEFVLPYGASLGDLLSQVKFGKYAQPEAIQLMRKSVKERQKETLEAQLRALENSVLTARSNTVGEAELREREAGLILQWVERARKVEPRGMVSLAGAESRNDILLEPGDVIRIPRISNLVMIHGDVLFPSAMAFQGNSTVEDYIDQAGGFTQNSRNSNVLLLHRDGTFRKVSRGELDSKRLLVVAGDEIFVLPRVATKNVQIASDIINIFYQLALSAGVVIGI
ncbi:polysaccharide biosynthesis/export family protein [Kordiimonas pumila]|uniref:Polysaccharide biosynthesis/export family protein n=1 Tax=Kordiimonas pumila TaxID=2161677 RepID=A0ABV7D3I4_9PROT|nr:polysaccharide biosynthesis/export family protein [Kordiimonas pumila]